MSAAEPKIVGLLCHWCAYAGADRAGQAGQALPRGFMPVRVMCTSRVHPRHILQALAAGADGVLVLGCHPGECNYSEGNLMAAAQVKLVTRYMEARGLDPARVQLQWVSSEEGEKLARVVGDFSAQLKELGRLSMAQPAKEANDEPG